MKSLLRRLGPPSAVTPVAAALAFAFAPPASSQGVALPMRPSVVSGSASVARQTASQLNVTQLSQNAVINWQSFSIGAGGKVQFDQPSAQSVALNRVVGTEPSTIFGNLSANGRVFLVNPGGVLFAPGSSVNVGGLVASTLNIADADFNAGRYVFSRGAASPASVANEGALQARPGGTIALIGSTVRNSGTIDAPQGTAALAAGKTVTLDFQGDGLTQLRVTEADMRTLVDNGGTIAADGGRVMMVADAFDASAFVVNQSGVVRARSLESRNGDVVLAGGSGDVSVSGSIDASGRVGSVGGGAISVSGRNVGLLGSGPSLDASGNTGGGSIALRATSTDEGGGVVAIAPQARLLADAVQRGDGGSIRTDGSSLRFHGSAQARGGDVGGDGGSMKITAGGVDLGGARVDLSAARGKAGTWNIDPFDINIVTSAPEPPAVPGPTTPPFTAVANSYILAGDLSAALDRSTNVTVSTGDPSSGYGGVISIASNVAITRGPLGGAAPITLRFDAARSIDVGPGSSIRSNAGPLNIDFNANANSAVGSLANLGTPAIAVLGGPASRRVTFATAGGSVRFFGQSNPVAGFATSSYGGVDLQSIDIDTRGSAGNGGVSIRGASTTVSATFSNGVTLSDTTINTGSGSIGVTGVAAGPGDASGVFVTIGSTLANTSGATSIAGLGPTEGVLVDLRSSVSSDSGAVSIAGSSVYGGATSGVDTLSATISGADVLIRASASDPNAIHLGPIRATRIVNLRPANVDATGAVTDGNAPIYVGSRRAGAFGVGAADLAAINAPAVVIGSSTYNGSITLLAGAGGLTTDTFDLTLQTGPSGSIAVNSPLNGGARTLALATGGNITQASGAGISAARLLLRADGAALTEPANAVGTLAAVIGASGLNFVNGQALTLGPVPASGIDAATNQPQALDAGSLTGATMLVRTVTGDLTLAGNISANVLDLVTPGTFQNPSASTIAATTRGRLWSSTWIGEARGGLAGTSALPNVYGCTFGSPCAIALPATGLTFVYTRQPGLSVSIDNKTRVYGDANPAFTLTPTGLINGDSIASAVAGNVTTSASSTSDVRSYLLSGSALTSRQGYVLLVIDGTLSVTLRPLTVTGADLSRLYGDANPTFGGTTVGLASFDSPASLGVAFRTTATQASNVGGYPVAPTVDPTAARNYAPTLVNGTLRVNPATLVYVADPISRSSLEPNPALTGTLTGFRLGDTAATAAAGTVVWTTPAGAGSLPGRYAVDGGGLSATNYVFRQAATNATALTISGPSRAEIASAVAGRELGAGPVEARREDETTYLYDRNVGHAPVCVADSPSDDLISRSVSDLLSLEWSRVRSRPNIASCFDTGRRNPCSDF